MTSAATCRLCRHYFYIPARLDTHIRDVHGIFSPDLIEAWIMEVQKHLADGCCPNP
jgi:hypothetical protein